MSAIRYLTESDHSDEWELLRTKSVVDSDGFITDYSLYTNGDTFVCIFGDTDIYDPSNTDPDYETEDQDDAEEWFDSYNGFEDDDTEPTYLTLEEEESLEIRSDAEVLSEEFDDYSPVVAEPGDYVDFGVYGKLYICSVLEDQYWVTDEAEDAGNPNALGWYIDKSLAKKILSSPNDDDDE